MLLTDGSAQGVPNTDYINDNRERDKLEALSLHELRARVEKEGLPSA